MNPTRRGIGTLLLAALLLPGTAGAASRLELDARVQETLQRFYEHSPAGRELAEKARGVLVFPRVFKGGMLVGGEYGEGALLVGASTVDYYSIASASIGFQLGGQVKSEVLLFMDENAFARFRGSEGWKAGVDGSVAIATLGVGGELDTNTAKAPIIGFVFSNKGLMYNLTFEGSKISKIEKH